MKRADPPWAGPFGDRYDDQVIVPGEHHDEGGERRGEGNEARRHAERRGRREYELPPPPRGDHLRNAVRERCHDAVLEMHGRTHVPAILGLLIDLLPELYVAQGVTL